MNETSRDDPVQRPPWETATELPAAAIDALRRPIGEVVAIVATVDADGAPRTAAFGIMRPVSPTQLRFGCNRAHDTYANILRDGRVMVALFAPDVALGIRGRARMLQEQIQSLPSNAVIEVGIEIVKNDALPIAPVATGITYHVPDETAARLESYIAEVEAS